jgi:type I restriction enzyme S subunit
MGKIETLKDCCSFQEGYVNPSQKFREYFGGNIKWLRASDLTGFFVHDTEKTLSQKGYESAGTSAFMFKKDTLAISKSGTIGTLGILKDEMCGNRAVINIDVDKTKADLFYIFYLLKYKNKELISKAHGSIQKNLYISVLEQTKLNHRDLSTQQKIAAVLSALDAKIELNQRINAELESMAKTLYDYWFVQFDFPNEKGKPYKSAGGGMVWNDELKREIPLGWAARKVREFAETSSGGTPLSKIKEYYENGNIPWINSGELNDPFIVRGSSFITEAGLNNSSAKMFPANTVLVALYGATAGKVSLLRIEACTNQAVCALLPKTPIFTNFLKYGFGNLYDYLVALSSGSARDNLSQEIIRNIIFAMPPDDNLFEEFNKIVNPLLEKIVTNLLESQTLAELRDWLLPMLMNGQIQVQT